MRLVAGLLPQNRGFHTRTDRVGLVIGRVAIGQIFPQVL
jgi:hypothetical protein